MLSFQAWNWEFFAFIIFSCLEHGMLPNQMLAADLLCLVEKKLSLLFLRQYSSEPGVKVIRFFLKDAVAFLQILEYHWGAVALKPAYWFQPCMLHVSTQNFLIGEIYLSNRDSESLSLFSYRSRKSKPKGGIILKFSGNFFDVRFVC